MGINIRQKGANGEREICDMLNFIIYTVMGELQYSKEEQLRGMSTVQRNQNQTAVGGCDLTNTFGLAIEVKRQEQLSINTWWKQCVASAERNEEVPVLIYRQNGKAWRVVTYVFVNLPTNKQLQVRAEFDVESFKVWFTHWVRVKLLEGAVVRS